MSQEAQGANVAAVPPGGPLCLNGRIVVEEDGQVVRDTDDVALCRCGHSRNKPFCDGSHRGAGFADPGLIQGGRLVPGRGESAAAGPDSEPVVIVCAKDGPLLVRGPLTLVAADGQRMHGAKGALCRCGESSTKPFCDGAHKGVGFTTGPDRG